jgi:IS5 family transposase
MRELRRLLRQSAEQAGWSGEAAIDASGFQRDQTSYHYRKRANFSFQAMKTTILIDVNSLAIKDVHYTTRKSWEELGRVGKSWDSHIGMQVFRRNAEDLRILAADANFLWSALREECRSESTRPLIRHREQTPLKEAHNARMDDEIYHQRWMSETGFSLLKEDDGEKLRSRSWHGQFRELTRKCIVHNLSQAASCPRRLRSFSGVLTRGITVIT